MEQLLLQHRLDRIETALDRMAFLLSINFDESLPVSPKPITDFTPITDFINADEAAKILGLPVTRSRTHTRRLAWYRDHGYITKFWGKNKYTYSRKEINSLAKRIESLEVIIPPVT
jgi:uncharacterized protein YecE (DUF72 family)